MPRRPLAFLSACSLLAAVAYLGCAGAGGTVDDFKCVAGATTPCTCDGGASGSRICEAAGWGACSCEDAGPIFDVSDDTYIPDAPPKCGDMTCNGTETCATCPRDCGKCPKCDFAPSCTGAIAVPTTSTPLPDFDNKGRTLYTCGVGGDPSGKTACLDPQLRIRIRRILVTKNGVWPGKLDMYCLINASDGGTSEVAVTPLQRSLGDGAELVFDPSVALFWGQKDLRTTINNLTVTYRCFRNTDPGTYTKVFGTIKDEAIKAGGVAGPWGWAFGLGGIAAGVIEAAVSGSGGDTERLHVQQTIDSSALLDMTNGRIWSIQQSGDGGGLNGKWDWTIEVESWGCADARPVPK